MKRRIACDENYLGKSLINAVALQNFLDTCYYNRTVPIQLNYSQWDILYYEDNK